MPWGGDEYKAPNYKKYKAEKFEKNKQKVLMILNGIDQTSLKSDDKKKLIAEIKALVLNF
jgi:hypothetical protein